MSVVLVYKRNDVVYMACDCQFSNGDTYRCISKNMWQKITAFDNGVVVGSAGSANISTYFSSHPEYFNLGNDRHFTKEFIVNKFIPVVRKKLVEQGLLKDEVEEDRPISLDNQLIIVDGNNVFALEEGHAFKIEHYYAIGSGECYCAPYFLQMEKAPDDQIERLMVEAIKTSAKDNLYINSKIMMWNSKDKVLKEMEA